MLSGSQDTCTGEVGRCSPINKSEGIPVNLPVARNIFKGLNISAKLSMSRRRTWTIGAALIATLINMEADPMTWAQEDRGSFKRSKKEIFEYVIRPSEVREVSFLCSKKQKEAIC